jgi:hypothetical protein
MAFTTRGVIGSGLWTPLEGIGDDVNKFDLI